MSKDKNYSPYHPSCHHQVHVPHSGFDPKKMHFNNEKGEFNFQLKAILNLKLELWFPSIDFSLLHT